MTNPDAPACPRCGHPDEPGRWCNWCGAWLGPPREDSTPTASRASGAPTAAARTPPVATTVTSAARDAATVAGASPAAPPTAAGPSRPGRADDTPTDPTTSPATPSVHVPSRAALLAIVGIVALAVWALPRLLPDAPRPEGPRAQAAGTVDVTATAWVTEDMLYRPSRWAPPPGPLQFDLTDSTAVIRVDGQLIEVDRGTGDVVDRRPVPGDSSIEPQLVVSDSVRIVDPVGGDILRVIEIPAGWYVLDDRDRGGRILVARTDPSGLSPFDSLAALDLTSGRMLVFEAEAPQALVGGVLTPEGTRVALVREFDRNGLYIDVEREALSIGQIRLPTPESLVDPDRLWLDAVGSTVAVAYERSFPGRPVATTLHLRDAGGAAWDAEIPGGTPIAGVALQLDAGQPMVVVRRADNQITAWVDGAPTWTVGGPPRLVRVDDVAIGPRDGAVLARTTEVTPWHAVAPDGRSTSTPVQGTDMPVPIDAGFVFSRAGELRAIDGRAASILDREPPVRGIPTAGYGDAVVGAFTVGCGATCVVDLATRQVILRTTELPGRNRWFLGANHVAADGVQPQAGVTVVRIADGEVVSQLPSAGLAGSADDDHVVVEVTGDDGATRLGWLPLEGGQAATVTAPPGAQASNGAYSGDVGIVPTSRGLARVDRGGLRWEVDLPGITTAPVVVGDDVVVGRDRGIVRLSIDDGSVVAASPPDLFPAVVWWLIPAGDLLYAGGDGYVAGLAITQSGG